MQVETEVPAEIFRGWDQGPHGLDYKALLDRDPVTSPPDDGENLKHVHRNPLEIENFGQNFASIKEKFVNF